jgi:spermidine synthase
LLPQYNMAIATYVAVAINVAVAVLALVVAAFSPHKAPAETQRETRPLPTPGAWAVYVAIALSGVSALGAEVVWTRLVSLMLGATVYTFSIILAVFLCGLGIGSSLGSIIARSASRPRLAFGVCQMLLVFASGWAITMITRSLPYWPINPSLASSAWYTFQLDLARSFWAILPPTILWGASFPLALGALATKGADPGRLVGGTYAANTVGAILGSLVFSLFLVPMVGTQWSHQVILALPAVAALLLLAPFVLGTRASADADGRPAGEGLRIATAAGILGMLALTVFLGWTVVPIPWGVAAYGRQMMQYPNLVPGIHDADETGAVANMAGIGGNDNFCRYFGEGLNGTVCVSQVGSIRYFHSAGKVQASSDPADMHLQRMLGHISALLAKENKDVLVIACGAGVTAGSFVPYKEVKKITICDIEPLVPHHVAEKFFEHENHGVIKDPRTTVVLDDGRHFIRTSKEKFDIITSDPIDPWVKGCAALNTVEYYQMCKDHLKPGGVMSLWIPLYESDDKSIKSVLATFFKVFPKGILWSNDVAGKGYDAVLFGQAEGTEVDVDELQARLDSEKYAAVKESLRDAGFNDAVDLLSTYAGRAEDLQKWMEDAQINTDADLRLQYLAGMAYNSYMGDKLLDGIRKYYKFPNEIFKGGATERLKVMLNRNAGVAKSP